MTFLAITLQFRSADVRRRQQYYAVVPNKLDADSSVSLKSDVYPVATNEELILDN